MSSSEGASPSATGPAPQGAEPAAQSQAEPLVPSAAQKLYEKRPDLFFTGDLGADGEEITQPVPWNDLTEERRRDFEKTAELEGKSIEQIATYMAAFAPVIELYADNVARAEERFQRERTFLADLMAEYLRLAHYIAGKGAHALAASGMEAATAGETEGLDPEDDSPVAEGQTPKAQSPNSTRI